jgi:uncharacterized membrane protein
MNEKTKAILKRFKSKTLWVAIIALIAFLVKEISGVEIGDTLNTVLNLVTPILVALGLLNDPTTKGVI